MKLKGKYAPLLKAFLEDEKFIKYRPAWADKEAGGVGILPAIFLQQVLWRYETHGEFYKFNEPCNHPAYKKGDSWTEELKMTRRELETARKAVGCKVKKATRGTSDAIVEYWQDNTNQTRYLINERNFEKFLEGIYYTPEEEEESVHSGMADSYIPDSGVHSGKADSYNPERRVKPSPNTEDNLQEKTHRDKTSQVKQKDISLLTRTDNGYEGEIEMLITDIFQEAILPTREEAKYEPFRKVMINYVLPEDARNCGEKYGNRDSIDLFHSIKDFFVRRYKGFSPFLMYDYVCCLYSPFVVSEYRDTSKQKEYAQQAAKLYIHTKGSALMLTQYINYLVSRFKDALTYDKIFDPSQVKAFMVGTPLPKKEAEV